MFLGSNIVVNMAVRSMFTPSTPPSTPPSPCLDFFWNIQSQRPCANSYTFLYSRMKITYHKLLVDFFHNKLISMQDVEHMFICCIYMQINSYHHSKFMHQWVISQVPVTIDAELNRKFPFGINLRKILPDLLR